MPMTSFLFAAVGVALIVVTLPVTLELAVLTAASFLPKRKVKSSTSPVGLNLAVIVPAHNEELLIARSVRSVLESAGLSQTRVVVIAHNCSDGTAGRAADAGAEVLVYNDPNARGKGFALRQGFERVFSQGADAALVIDADSLVSENLVGAVREAISRGASIVQCRYEMASGNGGARAKLAALALRGFNLLRPTGRDRLGLSCGILGNGFAIPKSVFLETPYNALSLVEDLEYHLHLVMAGHRVHFLDQAKVSAELPPSPAGETTQRSRWEGGRFLAARRWTGPLLKQVLGGRLRLLEPLMDLSGLPLAYAALALLLALSLPLEWLRIYAAVALAIVGLHVLAAAWAGEEFWSDVRLLAAAPAYILWKLRIIPRLLRDSSAGAGWVRTEREPVARKL
jgi:cellulose synthase/poly-beta-1,6-N-acetylglucosamine synthase-like glycosyltransferase